MSFYNPNPAPTTAQLVAIEAATQEYLTALRNIGVHVSVDVDPQQNYAKVLTYRSGKELRNAMPEGSKTPRTVAYDKGASLFRYFKFPGTSTEFLAIDRDPIND